jgi:hypothetical protein
VQRTALQLPAGGSFAPMIGKPAAKTDRADLVPVLETRRKAKGE